MPSTVAAGALALSVKSRSDSSVRERPREGREEGPLEVGPGRLRSVGTVNCQQEVSAVPGCSGARARGWRR
eukprot:4255817-Pyramimonas_sp.AAC.1